jgi:GMP synthase (glutamine-hydrolysing)
MKSKQAILPAMLQTVAFRHVPFEDLDLLGPLLARRGHAVRYIDVPLTDWNGFDPLEPDLLVVLGGPMGVYEADRYPYLEHELRLIRHRLHERKPTLGICLGSQLMAGALGARVYPSGVQEIGWAPVTLSDEGRASCLRPLDGMHMLHWHGDTFDLPADAVRLASSELCANQAFAIGRHALALQFHAETTGPGLERWFVGHSAEIAATPGINVPDLRAQTTRSAPAAMRAAEGCFGEWLTAAGL